MKFGQSLRHESEKLESSLLGDGKAAFVLYKDLKKQLKCTTREHGLEVERRKASPCEDECALCLENFNTLSAGFKTACGHTFHPVCFVDAVTEGPCKCPLCRRSLQETLPKGVDSVTLGFAAKMRIQADEIQQCYCKLFYGVRTQIRVLSNEANASRYTNIYTMFSGQKRRLHEQLDRVNELIDRVLFVLEYVRINLTAFRKICKKIDKQLGSSMGQQVPARLVKRRFYQDCAVEGNGKVKQLYDTLVSLGNTIAAKLQTAPPGEGDIHNPSDEQVDQAASRDEHVGRAEAPREPHLKISGVRKLFKGGSTPSKRGAVFQPKPFPSITSAILCGEIARKEDCGCDFVDIEKELQAFADIAASSPESMTREGETMRSPERSNERFVM